MRVIQGIHIATGGLLLLAAPFFAETLSAGFPVSGNAAPAQTHGQSSVAVSKRSVPAQGAHRDHNPKHGGIFFMSMDNRHHLEGVFVSLATFRVYLYDERTRPLTAHQARLASGTIQIGDSSDAPKISLVPGKSPETLEASLGNPVKFPVTITLLLHLPGMEPNAKPELFSFTFMHYSVDSKPGPCGPMSSMPNMHC